jgi:hypothetical protein
VQRRHFVTCEAKIHETNGASGFVGKRQTSDSGELQYTMKGTEFFHCASCDVECRIDFEAESGDFPRSAPRIIRHCPEGQEISIVGKVTGFQERRGGVWVNVQRWIYAA